MDNNHSSANNVFRGLLYIIAGILLLLHTLGWLQKGVNTLMIFGSLWLITYGFFVSGLFHKIVSLRNKSEQ